MIACNTPPTHSPFSRYISHKFKCPPFCALNLPITYRRVEVALQYLVYVLTEKPVLPYEAMHEAHTLAISGSSSWLSDLHLTVQRLIPTLNIELGGDLTVTHAEKILTKYRDGVQDQLRVMVRQTSRLPLITARLEGQGPAASPTAMRPYLTEDMNPEDRIALTRLICGDHPFAVEALRRSSGVNRVPREWRICRFCKVRSAVEDEGHILFGCRDTRLTALRLEFRWRALDADRAFRLPGYPPNPLVTVTKLLRRTVLLPALAAYVRRVFVLCEETPILRVHNDEELAQLDEQ